MHACARSVKQKYGSIYIYVFLDENVSENGCMYIYIYIYIYIYGRKKQINYKFIPTSLFRGRPLIRGFNENKLYHRLYTI